MPSSADRILQSIATKMRADFEGGTGIIAHNLSKGRAREELVAEFLKRYLPSTVRVAQSAQIITADDDVSGEVDIVVCDPGAPRLYDERAFRVLPIESVYGVVSVKSSLKPSDVSDAASGVRRVKELRRLAHRPQVGAVVRYTNLYDREWTDHFPTLGHIFAFESGDLHEIARALSNAERGTPHEQRVDAIYLFDKGLIVRSNPQTLAVELTASKGGSLQVIHSDHPLRGMLLQLHQLYSAAWNPGVDLTKYFGTNLGEPAGQVVSMVVDTDDEGRPIRWRPD